MLNIKKSSARCPAQCLVYTRVIERSIILSDPIGCTRKHNKRKQQGPNLRQVPILISNINISSESLRKPFFFSEVPPTHV